MVMSQVMPAHSGAIFHKRGSIEMMKGLLKIGMGVAFFVGLSACSSMPASVSDELATARLTAIVDARSDEKKVRDNQRNPQQTLEFFGIKPGMTVAEVLPGGGWYTEITAPYVGSDGTYYGVNYDDTMWAMFGFFSQEVIAERIASMDSFKEKVAAMSEQAPVAKGFAFGRIPTDVKGTVDFVLMIRALHNLNRFEEQASTRTQGLSDVYQLLKPGGMVGVVQHRAPEQADDDWAAGQNGYLKTSAVIAMFESAGFEYIDSSEVNANQKDQPTMDDYVWRLPPSLRTENKEAMRAIGESDRMTLKFKKP